MTAPPSPTEARTALTAPAPVGEVYDLSRFDCGTPSLNEWLRKRARKNQNAGASRTYVICQGEEVIGFYCLAAGAVLHDAAPGKVKRNMPEPIPVMVLGRLAIDRRWQGIGIGVGLLRDAVFKALQAAEIAGIRALLVHAMDDTAKAFYLKHGFQVSPVDPLTLMVSLSDIRVALISS